MSAFHAAPYTNHIPQLINRISHMVPQVSYIMYHVIPCRAVPFRVAWCEVASHSVVSFRHLPPPFRRPPAPRPAAARGSSAAPSSSRRAAAAGSARGAARDENIPRAVLTSHARAVLSSAPVPCHPPSLLSRRRCASVGPARVNVGDPVHGPYSPSLVILTGSDFLWSRTSVVAVLTSKHITSNAHLCTCIVADSLCARIVLHRASSPRLGGGNGLPKCQGCDEAPPALSSVGAEAEGKPWLGGIKAQGPRQV